MKDKRYSIIPNICLETIKKSVHKVSHYNQAFFCEESENTRTKKVIDNLEIIIDTCLQAIHEIKDIK